MICSLYCTVIGCHAVVSFPHSLHPSSHPPFPRTSSFFILQRHNTTTEMHLNIKADTNSICTRKDYNIETEYMFAGDINFWSVIHRSLFLFICSIYNRADVWRADHSPVYEKREGEKQGSKSILSYSLQHGSLLPPKVLNRHYRSPKTEAVQSGKKSRNRKRGKGKTIILFQ